MNTDVDPDIPAMIGASAALSISGIPFNGPMGAARVGYKNDNYILNPGYSSLKTSRLDLVVAGTKDVVLMVESEADILSEETMLGAVMFGHEQLQTAISAIQEFADSAGKPAWDWRAPEHNEPLIAEVESLCGQELGEAYKVAAKLERQERVGQICEWVCEELVDEEQGYSEGDVLGAFNRLEKKIVRGRILSGEKRIDGRDKDLVRPVTVRTGILPRTHGSALFTRGETQALVVTTLGTGRDAQIIDAIEGEFKDNFILHYNFPPFSVGETGFVGSPKRREIGHGKLTKRGIRAVIPTEDEFPYVIRVVSEITESNGSSSMASVCGTSLSLMDAGVPVKAPAAGIAMGLIKEGDDFVVLTDILGDEDHLGDMDFKVTGTSEGITALQMDIKISGVTREIMRQALYQAREGRLHILNEMVRALEAPRTVVAASAPRIHTLKINPDKIRDIIGPGGKMIRSIVEETGAKIDVEDDGTVCIASPDTESLEKAMSRIERVTAEAEIGQVYNGLVKKVMDFGAFVEILPGRDGLVHISQLSDERVRRVTDVVQEGDEIPVKVLDIDRQGKIRLSHKDALNEQHRAGGKR